MKKNVFVTLIKDSLIAGASWGIAAMMLNSLFPSFGTEGAMAMAIYFAGLPFGWRIASRIITAVSFKGFGIKFLIATFIGCFAVVGILALDILRCVGPLLRLCWKLISGLVKGIVRLIRDGRGSAKKAGAC